MKQLLPFILTILSVISAEAQRIVFTPQWLPQAQFAGYYIAQEKGFYIEEGLDVEFNHPSASYPAFDRMIDGNSHIITMQLPQAMSAIDKGFPLVNILQTSQHNSLLIVPRNNKIKQLEDLRNKRVGIWKAGFGESALALDKQHNLNIEWIQHLQGINLLISGAIDATLAMKYNEYWLIMASGIHPEHVFKMSDYGLDIPGDGLYVSRNFYDAHPEIVAAFARASKRGWEWAMEHPEETLSIVIKVMKEANVTTNIHHQRWMLKEVLLMNCDECIEQKNVKSQLKTEINIINKEKASFRLKPEHMEVANELFLNAGIIKQPIDYQQLWKGDMP